MKQLLITGASGLIGGRLIAALRHHAGLRVRAASRIERRWPDGVEGVVIDVARPDTLAAACTGVHAVVNLASMTERECADHPEMALRTNAGGTLALVRAALDAGVRRFVQMSTIKVYGANPAGTITEASPTRPASHYGITHRAAEHYALLHPDAVVLRLANSFGAPATSSASAAWSLIANDFCRQAATGDTIRLHGAGNAWRNFVPLDDVTDALRAAITSLPPGTYNLGASEAMTIRAMAQRVARLRAASFGGDVTLSFGAEAAPDAAEPLDYRSDRLRSHGVRLDASVDDELTRTLEYARDTFGARAHV